MLKDMRSYMKIGQIYATAVMGLFSIGFFFSPNPCFAEGNASSIERGLPLQDPVDPSFASPPSPASPSEAESQSQSHLQHPDEGPGATYIPPTAPQEQVSPAHPTPEMVSPSAAALSEDAVDSEVQKTPRHLKGPRQASLLPSWGLQFSFSPNAWGGKALTIQQGKTSSQAFFLGVEYQPAFFQKIGIGILSLGPLGEVFTIPGQASAPRFFSIYGVGGQIRYQARFFREQILVPIVAYSMEYFRYQFVYSDQFPQLQYPTGISGNFLLKGPTVGLWLYLNLFEPSAASEFFINQGVLRSYLIGEYRMLSGNDSVFAISGGSYYVGVRVEL